MLRSFIKMREHCPRLGRNNGHFVIFSGKLTDII